MLRFLYNILFLIGFVLSSPYYFWRLLRRGNWLTGFGERFAQYDTRLKQALTNRHPLWLHAVSVGEVGLCTQLIKAIEPRLPNAKIVVSTTTTTGMGELKKRLPLHISKIYFPVDRHSYVARAQAVVHPEAIVLVEAEIWPNFIWRAQEQNIPLFLVNARISDRSYPRYKRFGFFFRPLFAAFTGVGAQTETDAARLRELGCRPEAVRVVGSLKFDAANTSSQHGLDVAGLLRQAGADSDAPVLVCGSTHDGEEKLLAEIFLRLHKSIPKLFLVLVPRHFERTRDVERDLRECGVRYVLRTNLSNPAPAPDGGVNCLVVNTTGELRAFYEYATVAFVGKSMTAKGGQNPIEPCAMGKATVFGPNMQNFADVVRLLLKQNAVQQVTNVAELESTLGDLLKNPAQRTELGRNAINVVRQNLGAAERTVDMILAGMANTGIYIAPKRQATGFNQPGIPS